MGNAGSSSIARERQKSSLSDVPLSPNLKDDHEFEFDKKYDNRLVFHGGSSQEEEEPYYTKPIQQEDKVSSTSATETNQATTSDDAASGKSTPATPIPQKKPALPTVFKWDGGGKQVFISGTFSDWKILPMVRSHGDFVTIIDLPEGEHEYKFYVDGEWKHDPKIVCMIKNTFLAIFTHNYL